ncbi:hypothetical protein H0E87_000397 [Populus deltoides]|uniref:Uncharacterized protein n=1 Tax=Populus deltoides TaxID=3696 RepID=A0A8T2ZP19_POPDE|nr:hypothetical protein H0E87_000397 [Populus deltoides]
MAKNRNKKKEKNGAVSMDVAEPTVSDLPQAMDTSESGAQKSAPVTSVRKTKGRPMKRSKNVRKMKAIAKAISKNEITAEKGLKKDEDGKKKASVKSKKTAAMQINATYNYTSGLPSAPPVLHPASNPTTTHGKNAIEGKCRKDIWIYICAMEKQNLSV